VAILIAYEFIKNQSKSPFLGQINISSLIIAIGISSEVAKTVQAVYKNARFELQK